MSNSALKYATSAVAAKHLSRVNGVTTIDASRCRRLPMTQSYPNSHQVDWEFKAANYFYKALTFLPKEFSGQLEEGLDVVASNLDHDTSNLLSVNLPTDQSLCCHEDGSLAAAAILTMYHAFESATSKLSQ
jgi:hypothetical protein